MDHLASKFASILGEKGWKWPLDVVKTAEFT